MGVMLIWSMKTAAFAFYEPGAHFVFFTCNSDLIEICFAVIQFLIMKLQQIFAHAMTAQLSWHVQNFVAITELEFPWIY